MLHREVPLLHVSRSQVAGYRKYALPQSSIGGQRNGRNRWSAREHKGRMNAIERRLLHCLEKRKLRCREWCRNARLLDKDDAIARAHHRLRCYQVAEAESRPQVAVVQFTG